MASVTYTLSILILCSYFRLVETEEFTLTIVTELIDAVIELRIAEQGVFCEVQFFESDFGSNREDSAVVLLILSVQNQEWFVVKSPVVACPVVQ